MRSCAASRSLLPDVRIFGTREAADEKERACQGFS